MSCFNLDHQAQIEEWAALRTEAGRALCEMLLELVDELVVEVEERGELVARTSTCTIPATTR